MKTTTAIPFPDLPRPNLTLAPHTTFKRVEIGQMFGVHPSLITKDCQALNKVKAGKIKGFEGIDHYYPVRRQDLWMIYAIEMFRRVHWAGGIKPTRRKFVEQVNAEGEKAINYFVELGGGSRQHFERVVNNYVAKQSVARLQDHLIDVEAS